MTFDQKYNEIAERLKACGIVLPNVWMECNNGHLPMADGKVRYTPAQAIREGGEPLRQLEQLIERLERNVAARTSSGKQRQGAGQAAQ